MHDSDVYYCGVREKSHAYVLLLQALWLAERPFIIEVRDLTLHEWCAD